MPVWAAANVHRLTCFAALLQVAQRYPGIVEGPNVPMRHTQLEICYLYRWKGHSNVSARLALMGVKHRIPSPNGCAIQRNASHLQQSAWP